MIFVFLRVGLIDIAHDGLAAWCLLVRILLGQRLCLAKAGAHGLRVSVFSGKLLDIGRTADWLDLIQGRGGLITVGVDARAGESVISIGWVD